MATALFITGWMVASAMGSFTLPGFLDNYGVNLVLTYTVLYDVFA